MKAVRILLASHGTTGARAADRAALELCQEPGIALFHLTVVPDLWYGMMGDDWLNNVSTRDAYCRHVESELEREMNEHRETMKAQAAAQNAHYQAEVKIGTPTECLLAYAESLAPDIVVVGSRRPRGAPGLRSRMHVDRLLARLAPPLLIIPYPPQDA
jgi:nucleotide-binding universal stress UspA family protein